ncbi:L-lactate dehydrogenase A [Smittium mucronatum]|uniref:L-lactate dehydrogenase n=1 Tax=Smittium mucronatum TaxID=133383 RepID=A0A1R0H899_9FUNG|nr:L-lactate dehydrogenase A [Smittium mucronatum]
MNFTHRVSIIGGGGNVGAAVAFALVVMQLPVEILLLGASEKSARAQALDIRDAAHFSTAHCRAGTSEEVGCSDIIVITAGARQRPGEPRSNLIDRNYVILDSIIKKIQPIKPTAIILMVTNPVDVLTSLAQKLSGLPKSQVIGSGTFLDSGRLRNYLSRKLNVNSNSIHASMLGEHGDTQFVGWSVASIAGSPLLKHPLMANVDLAEIENAIAHQAYEIIEAKGSTYFGVGYHVAALIKCILTDGHKIYPVCNYNAKYDTYLSVPAILGSDGATPINLNLSDEEEVKLERCAESVNHSLGQVNEFAVHVNEE